MRLQHFLVPIIGCVLILFSVRQANAQGTKSELISENEAFRQQMNREFADSNETPLTTEGIKNFKKLDFFRIRQKYCVMAILVRTPDAQAFEMPRSKGNTGSYRKFGEASFVLNGDKCKLSVYQSTKLLNDEEYKDYLFLPFTDLSSGKQTYSGGRFLDLLIPAGDTLIIDFNKAYNPLCCYNSKYSCPIPPGENNLKVKVLAGVKNYKH